MSESFNYPQPEMQPGPEQEPPLDTEHAPPRRKPIILGERVSEPLVIPPGSELERFIADIEERGYEHEVFGSGLRVLVSLKEGRTYKFYNGVFVLSTNR